MVSKKLYPTLLHIIRATSEHAEKATVTVNTNPKAPKAGKGTSVTSSCSSKGVICFTTLKQFPISRLSPNECSSLNEVIKEWCCGSENRGHEDKPIFKLGSMTQTHKEDAKEVCGVL